MENRIAATWNGAWIGIFEWIPKLYLSEFLQAFWCRIFRGHVMVKLGEVRNGTLYECARCPMVEVLKTLD